MNQLELSPDQLEKIGFSKKVYPRTDEFNPEKTTQEIECINGDFSYNNEDPRIIPCIGIDRRQHVCFYWSDFCYCGVKVLRKKLLRDDWELSSCYECTY